MGSTGYYNLHNIQNVNLESINFYKNGNETTFPEDLGTLKVDGTNGIFISQLSSSAPISVGHQSGIVSDSTARNNSIAIGNFAATSKQSDSCVAIGVSAGRVNQGVGSVAIGNQTAWYNQGENSVAMGYQAGYTGQDDDSVAIGITSGMNEQGVACVALGSAAAKYNQGDYSVAMGHFAGSTSQGSNCVAIGNAAGGDNQRDYSVSIGYASANNTQGTNSVAIGNSAGNERQGSNSVAIGYRAGVIDQGNNCIAIGYQACGETGQADDSVIISTHYLENTGRTGSFFIAPLRGDDLQAGDTGVMIYNATTGEVTFETAKTFVIDHPNDSTKYLVHSCLEGPEAGIYYRGIAEIESNSVEISLPDYVVALGFDFTIQLTNIYKPNLNNNRVLSCSEVSGGKFNVYGEKGPFYWLVHASRGFINVEPSKDSVNVKGDGPYKYI